MSRKIVSLGRILLSALTISLLSFSSFSQVQLREALDFDGDQKADFSIFRPSDNTWYIMGTTGSYTAQQWGIANEDGLVPGDYDGDNKADIAVFRETTGVWYVLKSSDSTFSAVGWGAEGDVPVARDYDGDGTTDIAIVRSSGGYLYWWILKTTGGYRVEQWGLDTDFAAPGDYDGDGKFDLCVQRPGATPTSPAFFYILGSQLGYFGYQWGISTDFSVPGDYDGDGKTDIAIVREGALATDNIVWWILRSDGQGYMAQPFGLSGPDFTAQADYDGDGRTEIGVWRQTDGQFYALNPTTGVLTQAYWGKAGDIPVATYDTH
ncbi:MAG: VCBS repeat-containing protein [Pyrinomonadaceae bacterium]